MAIKRRKAVRRRKTRKNPASPGSRMGYVSTSRASSKYGYPHRPVVYSSDGTPRKALGDPRGKKTVKYNPSRRRRIVKRNPAMNEILNLAINGSLAGVGIFVNSKIVPSILKMVGNKSPAVTNVVKLISTVGLGYLATRFMPRQYSEYFAVGLIGETVQSMLRTAIGVEGDLMLGQGDIMLGSDMMLGNSNLFGSDLLDGYEHSDGMENAYI